MQRTFFDYLEQAAFAFDLHDHHTAAVELDKALELVTHRTKPQKSPRPGATDVWSELKKSVNALSASEFSLSALCLNKALRKVKPSNLDQTVALTDAARVAEALRHQQFGSVASNLRHAAKLLDFQGLLAVGSRVDSAHKVGL